jgi:hypothetical protein
MFAALSGALILVVCGGCLQLGKPPRTDIWHVVTNTCYARYRHVWADTVFVSATSRVSVAIVVPAASGPAFQPEGERREAEAMATQQTESLDASSTVRSDASELVLQSLPSNERSTRFDSQATSTVDETTATSMSESSQTIATNAVSTQTVSRAASSTVVTSDPPTSGEEAPEEGTGAGTNEEGEEDGVPSSGREAVLVAESTAKFGEIEKHIESRSVSGYSLSMAELTKLNIQAKPAEQIVTAVMPELSVSKQPQQPTVRAGGRLAFTIELKNTGSLELLDIEVEDPGMEYMTYLGVRYPVSEWLLPFSRTVRQVGAHTFRVRGALEPGASVSFRILYRADAPAASTNGTEMVELQEQDSPRVQARRQREGRLDTGF